MKSRLVLLRVVAVAALGYFLWQAVQSTASRSWAEAAMHFGFACSSLALFLRPSYTLGPAMPSLAKFKALPPEHRLAGPAKIVANVGSLFIAAALILWLAS